MSRLTPWLQESNLEPLFFSLGTFQHPHFLELMVIFTQGSFWVYSRSQITSFHFMSFQHNAAEEITSIPGGVPGVGMVSPICGFFWGLQFPMSSHIPRWAGSVSPMSDLCISGLLRKAFCLGWGGGVSALSPELEQAGWKIILSLVFY